MNVNEKTVHVNGNQEPRQRARRCVPCNVPVGRYRSKNPLTVMEIRLLRCLFEGGTSCV